MGHSEIKKSRVIKKQIQSLEKKERKVLNRKQFKFVKDKMQPIQEKLEDKIPKGLQLTLENAFATSFKLVFEKGIDVIEKSYNKEEKNIQFDIQHYAVLKKVTHKNIKNIDKTAQKFKSM